MQADIEKQINHIIDAYNSLKDESAYLVLNKKGFLQDSKAIMAYNSNDFKVKIISSNHPTKEQFDDPFKALNGRLELARNGRKYTVEVENIKSLTHSLSDPFIATYYSDSITVDIHNINGKLKHTALLHIEELPTFSAFEVKKIKIGQIIHLRFFSVSINKVEYHCYCHENHDLKKVYFFIESMDEIHIEEFKEALEAITFSIALFNGDWYKGNIFIYSTKNSIESREGYVSAQYYYGGKPIITDYKICDTLRCSQYLEHIGQKSQITKLCSRVSSSMLSEICSRIYKDHKVKRIIELLIEGTNTKSVVLEASVYSIALETISNLVLSEKKDILNPIQDNELVNKIHEKLNKVIEEYSSFMSDEAIHMYLRRISDLNKPANVDRLAKAFEILGIKLNEHDQQTLKARDKFLHGSSPMKNFENNKTKEQELFLLATKFRMLLVMLIVKYLGYTGHIWNHYGEVKAFEKKAIVEHLIRFI